VARAPQSPKLSTQLLAPQTRLTANYNSTKDLPAASGDDTIVWADAVSSFNTDPIRFSPTPISRPFIDSWAGYGSKVTRDKVYCRFTSSHEAQHKGGQETTLLSLYISLMHFGGIIRAAGYKPTPSSSQRQPLRRQPHHRSDKQRTGHRIPRPRHWIILPGACVAVAAGLNG